MLWAMQFKAGWPPPPRHLRPHKWSCPMASVPVTGFVPNAAATTITARKTASNAAQTNPRSRKKPVWLSVVGFRLGFALAIGCALTARLTTMQANRPATSANSQKATHPCRMQRQLTWRAVASLAVLELLKARTAQRVQVLAVRLDSRPNNAQLNLTPNSASCA